jgi:CheY-like chemotaxis protein
MTLRSVYLTPPCNMRLHEPGWRLQVRYYNPCLNVYYEDTSAPQGKLWPHVGQKADMLTREQFLQDLRAALNHLYDANYLRQNILVYSFGLSQRFDASAALRAILIDTIAGLKPKPDDPAQEQAWHAYESLFCCFVQQLSQQVVADQLAMSARQLRREQQKAIELLADRLWLKYKTDLAGALETSQTLFGSELAWIKDTPLENPTNLDDELAHVMELAQPLATQNAVHLALKIQDGLTPLAVHPVALHQIMLNLLSIAMPRIGGGEANIEANLSHWEVAIRIRCMAPTPSVAQATNEETSSLVIAKQLAALSGGELTATLASGQPFAACLTLPLLQQMPVLVIDDNADALNLFQRYANGSRYRVIGTQDPKQVFNLAETHSPQVVVLDVMMPQVDGWMMLGRLRQHPLTRQAPIVVCTILPQEKLAMSLGASAFLMKPVTRQIFLTALDQQIATQAKTVDQCPE